MKFFSLFEYALNTMSKLPDPTYWLSTGGEAVGPYTLPQIRRMFRAGSIPATSQICPVGSEMWSSAAALLKHASNAAGILTALLVVVCGFVLWFIILIGIEIWQSEKRAQFNREWNAKTFEEMGLPIRSR